MHTGNIIKSSDILKQSLLKLAAHADAVIANLKGYLSVTRIVVSAIYGEGDLSSFRRILYSIIEKVHQRFRNTDSVTKEDIVLNAMCADFESLVLDLRLAADHIRNLFDSLSERELTVIRFHAAAVHAADVDDLVDHNQQILTGHSDPVRVLHDLGGIISILHQEHHKSGDGIKRRPQIVAHSLEHPVVDSNDAGIQDLMQAAAVSSPVLRVQIHSEKTIHAPDSLDACDASLISTCSSRLAVDAFNFRADDHPPVFRIPGPAFSHGVFLRFEHLAARDLSRIRPQFAHVAHDQLSRESKHLFDVWRDINRAAASAV